LGVNGGETGAMRRLRYRQRRRGREQQQGQTETAHHPDDMVAVLR
jgi:N-methylhydantoinase B/oxoprolinase/acetone carboxylase alpha subunit